MSTLICTIELDKQEEQGITIHVKSKNGDDEHKIQLNKEQIILTSRNGSNSTVTTQTANSIKLEVDGGKSVFHMDQDKIDINCKDFKLNASGDIRLSGQAIEANSSGDTKIAAGQNFTATGEIQATMSGNIATVEGKSIANVKGNIANVKGSLVKLG